MRNILTSVIVFVLFTITLCLPAFAQVATTQPVEATKPKPPTAPSVTPPQAPQPPEKPVGTSGSTTTKIGDVEVVISTIKQPLPKPVYRETPSDSRGWKIGPSESYKVSEVPVYPVMEAASRKKTAGEQLGSNDLTVETFVSQLTDAYQPVQIYTLMLDNGKPTYGYAVVLQRKIRDNKGNLAIVELTQGPGRKVNMEFIQKKHPIIGDDGEPLKWSLIPIQSGVDKDGKALVSLKPAIYVVDPMHQQAE